MDEKRADFFECKICNFNCSKKSNYDRHLLTAKHKNRTLLSKKEQKKCRTILDKQINKVVYECQCGKVYKARNSYWYHKKKCIYSKDDSDDEVITEIKESRIVKEENDTDYKELLIEAMKTMQQQQKQINEMIPLIGNNNNNTTNNFNLNIFLNDKCKDALNLTDFINSIQVQLKDLEYTADNGHVKGITNIFQNALSNLELDKRPMHCTDLKREVLYIKDNDEWHRDDEKEELKKAVDKVVNKNLSNTSEWLDAHPDHLNTESKDFDEYMKMTENSLGTGEENEQNKIVKNILKTVTIHKDKRIEGD